MMDATCSFTLFLSPDKENLPSELSALKRAFMEHKVKVRCIACGYVWTDSVLFKSGDQEFCSDLNDRGVALGKCLLKSCKDDRKRRNCFVKLRGQSVCISKVPEKLDDGMVISLYGLTLDKYQPYGEWELSTGERFKIGDQVCVNGVDGMDEFIQLPTI